MPLSLTTTASGRRSPAMVPAIIAMTGALELEVIAEGVETESQLEFLKQHGCFYFQGYQFGRSVPLAEFKKCFLWADIRSALSFAVISGENTG